MGDPDDLGVLLDHAQDQIVLLEADGTITYTNAAVSEILGVDPEAVVGESVFEHIHPEDVEHVRSVFEEIVAHDEYVTREVEYRVADSDGGWVWLESRVSSLTDDRVDGYVVSSRDVTDRVEAQRDARETLSRLKELALTTGEVLWMFDSDWSELLFVNPSVESVYGVSPEALEADPAAFLECIHPEDVPVVRKAMDRLSAGQSVDLEYRVDAANDFGTWVWVQGQPILEDGEVVRIAGFSRDITDRRRREHQLYVMDNLLRHNLRNDLNLILGNAELIAEEVPAVAEKTAVIRRTGEELLASATKERQIIDLLTAETVPVGFDLAAVIGEAIAGIRERYPDATVETNLPARAPVYGLEALQRAICELVENAIIHSEVDAPEVSVALAVENTGVTISIVDAGPPMADMESRVLHGDTDTSHVYHSSGLGLWLVYWIVELSDGSIAVETDEDGGNRVEISLPRPPASAGTEP